MALVGSHPWLCATFVGYNEELVEEAAQESLIRIYKALPRWHKENPLGAYLYGICRIACADVMRSSLRHGSRHVQIDEFESFAPESTQPSSEEQVLRQEASQVLARAMAKLDPDDRAMVYLHEVEDVSIAELSAMYKLSSGTVKSRLFRARDKLRTLVKEMGYELD